MNPTKFQRYIQEKVKQGKSVLLVAPTGLGKTFAVTGDLQDRFCKTIYAVPLRALGGDIRDAISKFKRNDHPIVPVIHHGDLQESELFSEEVIVTTYDQVVCGVPGLPLSLPLKAGHAVAGALLMSRLILDEVHMAWGISEQALPILLGIIDFRKKLGLQTVILTATLANDIAERISREFELELVIVGESDLADDEGLQLREKNRQVTISTLDLKSKGDGENKKLDYSKLDQELINTPGKRIYFANTVDRLQETYDRLIKADVPADKITVLHNRMPKSWRTKVEKQVRKERFGKDTPEGDWILLTNQVAEAGLDISAPLVISDPAPVDTLIQRAGRCARWFRNGITEGKFIVIKSTKANIEGRKGLAIPYRSDLALEALKSIPEGILDWSKECMWINDSWQGYLKKKKNKEAVESAFNRVAFALNLFDRAAQEHKPSEIAKIFRDILSVEVAVEEGNQVHLDDLASRDLQMMLSSGEHPETSSISLGKAYDLSKHGTAVVRFEDDEFRVHYSDYVCPGDILIVPSQIAYLHSIKGLCFGEPPTDQNVILSSDWLNSNKKREYRSITGRRQTLLGHTMNVMNKTYCRLTQAGIYRETLIKILKSLEPDKDSEQIANLIAELGRVAAAFHDLGKADERWQSRAREIDTECSSELIGRTLNTEKRMNIPHTPPGYTAIIKTCDLLLGFSDSAKHLIQSIALASARHHSSLLNPSTVKYSFRPHPYTTCFIKTLLEAIHAPQSTLERISEILEAAIQKPPADQIPLMLPNEDLFPIYALIGRSILLADREDAGDREIEKWRYE